jgi:protein polybromo-1
MNENPDAGFGEVSKIVGIEWKRLSDEQKRQYEKRAQYIAEERAKAELLTPNSKIPQV